ncbi:TIGR02444 family protein [Bradyrhizobium sp.]|uniref:TIGR02444 family protein n=1 Tax=Bradyrhizobium sp. TaxID=376 RepID=UPI003C7960A3
MNLSRPDLEADGWAFALELYARPGVADACLKLQNEASVDVMMLLMVAFAAVRHRILLTSAELRELDEACRPWREQIVWPLRAIRSELKIGPLPAPNNETEQFRSKVKAVELAAEQLQNQLLAERLPLRPPERNAVGPEELRSVLCNVASLFLERRGGKPVADPLSSINEIVDAATRDAR